MINLARYLGALVALLISSVSVANECNNCDLPLMPYPQQVICKEGSLNLGPTLAAVLSTENPRIEQALIAFGEQLKKQNGITLLREAKQGAVLIRINTNADSNLALGVEREAYQLVIDSNGIEITAEAWQGAFYALQTLLQLMPVDSDEARLPLVTIDDQPRFPWRGVLIDSSRHFFSVETLKRQLDGMAAAKLNVFHWHLTDDQGWRLMTESYPKLHQLTSQGLYYSQDDVKKIVSYAAARAIHVLPEVDMPGHASAIAHAYPELMSAPGPYPLEDRWGVHTPLLNPANPDVHIFAEKILTEVAALFPFGYVHIGGDEVNPRDWENNSDIQQFMAEKNLQDSQQLHAWFNQQLADILTGLDRKMIGWDEVLHPDLPEGTVVQSWQGPDALGRAVNQGFPAILSTGFYLDQPQYSDYHYRVRVLPEPLAVEETAGADELWQSWSFNFERKRGSAISGSFTLIRDSDGNVRGFIDFAGKSREAIQQVALDDQHIGFSVDTWMGPVQARLTYGGTTLAGDWVVGNAPYAVTGELIAASTLEGSVMPEGIAKAVIAPDKKQDVLGGEAALWSEMVTENTIDLRLWPRAFVVAERLWSDAALRDEAFMYERLDAVSAWSASVVGLQHFYQTEQALSRVFKKREQHAAREFIAALEPAHYYHRHHEKSVHETYSRRDRLDKLADVLPAESRPVQHFAHILQRWQKAPSERDDYQQLQQYLLGWKNSSARFIKYKDSDISLVAREVNTTATIGLELIAAIHKGEKMAQDQKINLRKQLRQAQSIRNEMVVALAYPLEALLDAERYYLSEDWTAEQSFTDGIEGPAVDRAGNLYAVNAQRQGTIGKVTGKNRVEVYAELPEGSIGNAIRFNNSGDMLVADYTGHNILLLTKNKQWQVLAHNSQMHQPNDIAVADNGTIYASDPNWADSNGQLWRIDPEGTTTLLEENMGTTNGIELSPDGRTLYVNESVQRNIWQYRVAEDGSLHNKQLFHAFTEHGMDGMSVDVKGNLYVARYGAGTIAIFSPAGELLREMPLTGQFPTNLTFGGIDGKRVFVTMQQRGMIESFISENPGSDWIKQQGED